MNQYLFKGILKDLKSNFQINIQCEQKNVDQSIMILQENTIYINFLYLSNLFFKTSHPVIQQNLDKIFNCYQTRF
ncbi:unnamed protein product [Paramecium sonneborni]|uniref:Uncharacterized protein n=1 Tax=Paramecium sonneborni TaxID=65129 RepID=A0A8S1MG93_9CILI|nr:unnamed protein product [Paramecium sonneborni]